MFLFSSENREREREREREIEEGVTEGESHEKLSMTGGY
jgi:hypothetical protein